MLRLRRDVLLFPEGKKKALTLSYDDGVTQDERFIKLLDTYGVKCTFNLNSGLMGENDWLIQPGVDVSHYKIEKDRIAEVYKDHEIAVHTVTHPDLAKVPQGMVAYEIAQCRKELEEIVSHPVTGMAYPMGTWSEQVIETAKCCGISYARTTKQNFAFDLPEDFLAWHPTCHHTETDRILPLLEKFLQPISDANYKSPQVYSLWGHAYEFDAFEQWELIENFLQAASGKEEIWYATNGEICDYVKAVEQLIYSATGDYIFNPTYRTIWKMIDQKVYKIPAGETIKVEKPL